MFEKVVLLSNTKATISRNKTVAVLIGNRYRAKVIVGNTATLFDIDPNSISVKYAKALYSTKANSSQPLYTKHVRTHPITHNEIGMVAKIWYPLKDGLRLKGSVNKGKYVIDKSFYLDGYEYSGDI